MQNYIYLIDHIYIYITIDAVYISILYILYNVY